MQYTTPDTMLDLTRFRAFIFDLDGTLIDSEKYHERAFARAMLELTGYRLTPQEERDFRGNTSRDYAQELAEQHALSLCPDRFVDLKFNVLYRTFRAELFPLVQEFLQHWHGQTLLAVASNSPGHFVQTALAQTGLLDTFDEVISRDDVAARKPDPDMILLALQRLAVPAELALVFEDSQPGLGAALAAGCPAVILNNPGIDLPTHLSPEIHVLTWQELMDLSR